jgi:hypothetical protein
MSSENDHIRNRCREIAKRLRPACITKITPIVQFGVEARIEYNPDGTATVEAADPDNSRALLALLHEFGHTAVGHGSFSRYTLPYHFKEYECEQWALEQLRELAPDMVPSLQRASREYIMDALREDFPAQEGLITEVLDYLAPSQREQIIKELNGCREQCGAVWAK